MSPQRRRAEPSGDGDESIWSKAKKVELPIIDQTEYNGFTEEQWVASFGQSWPCTHSPPHGIRLEKEGVFVRIRHLPESEGYRHVIMPIDPNRRK